MGDPLAHSHACRKKHEFTQELYGTLLGNAAHTRQVRIDGVESGATADELERLPHQLLDAAVEMPEIDFNVVRDNR